MRSLLRKLIAGLALTAAAGPASARDGSLEITTRQSEAPGAAYGSKVKLYSASKALVIGNNNYGGTGWVANWGRWPKLSNAIKDAEEVAKALTAQGFSVTLKKDLTSAELERTLKRFFVFEGADPEARLFVWFAGHGHTINGEGYIVGVDTPNPRTAELEFTNQAFSLRQLGQYMRLARAKHVLAVFDSCFAGAVFNVARSSPPRAITLDSTLPVRQLISSGDADQTVSDDGSFRKLFVDAIEGREPQADANGDGYITGTELGLFLYDKVTNLSESGQTPRYGKLNAQGFDRGDFVLERLIEPPQTASTGVTSPAEGGHARPTTLDAAQAWSYVKDSEDEAVLNAFRKQFGSTNQLYDQLAVSRIQSLKTAKGKEPQDAVAKQSLSDEAQAAAKSDASEKLSLLDPRKNTPTPTVHAVLTGAQKLQNDNFAHIAGKRVGIITNQTGRANHGVALVDVLSQAGNVKLISIFVPEHGFSGRREAGESVRKTVDKKTGVPVYSVYGETRKPTQDMLKDIDVLIFDIQDVGIRYYTFISTMGLAMQAAAEAGIQFLILDRPNPLGGEYVSGYVLEDSERSFVGEYNIPIAHGMTVGELAKLIQKEKLLPGLEQLDLSVISMEGWERWMRWLDISDVWIPTSPAISKYSAALMYGGLGFLEGTTISDGRGTDFPFTLIGADWIDPDSLAAALNAQHLPGLAFEATKFTPRSETGKPGHPKYENKEINGIRIGITDYRKVQPIEAGVVIFQLLYKHAREKGHLDVINQIDWLGKLAGTKRFYHQIAAGVDASEIVASWQADVDKFKQIRTRYLLYH